MTTRFYRCTSCGTWLAPWVLTPCLLCRLKLRLWIWLRPKLRAVPDQGQTNQPGHTHPWIDDDGLGKQLVRGCPGCKEERRHRRHEPEPPSAAPSGPRGEPAASNRSKSEE